MNIDYDVIIVGAGPAGITASIYLKRSDINCCLIEKDAPGGQLNKSSIVENYPGFKKITGPDLAVNFFDQVTNLKIPYIYGNVISIEDKDGYKLVKTSDKEYKCKAVILCVGRKPKSLNVDNRKSLEGHGISYCSLCDGYLYKNEDVAIIGGGNSALEEALSLANICKSVTIIHRSIELRGDDILIDKIYKKDNIKIMYNSEVSKFNELDGKLESLEIKNNENLESLKVKACFIFIGYEPATDFLKNLEILDEKGYIITDSKGRTKIPFVYAAGDIIKKDAYQIVTATGDGAVAAISCIKDFEN